MGKFTILCLTVLAAALNVKALNKDDVAEIKAALMVNFNECNKEFGVSEQDLKEAKEEKNIDKIDPCLIGCVFKRSGAIDEKGLFDTEKVTELSKKYLKSEDDQSKFAEIVKDCSKVNDEAVPDGEDGCERAKLLAICMAKHKEDLPFSRRRR